MRDTLLFYQINERNSASINKRADKDKPYASRLTPY